MSGITHINVGGTTYDIQDENAVHKSDTIILDGHVVPIGSGYGNTYIYPGTVDSDGNIQIEGYLNRTQGMAGLKSAPKLATPISDGTRISVYFMTSVSVKIGTTQFYTTEGSNKTMLGVIHGGGGLVLAV